MLSSDRIIRILIVIPFISYILPLIKDFILAVVETGPIPKHLALIMDGNRRYAKARSLQPQDGHNAGAESLLQVLDVSYKLGIKEVTVYAFSIENFKRPKDEVDALFGLLRDKLKMLAKYEGDYTKFEEVRVKIIGNKSLIPSDILSDLEQIEERTINVKDKILNVCFPYTSRDDIVHSVQAISQKLDTKEIETKDQINLKLLNNNMYMGPESFPLDLLIRTSGHTRLSDFMLWQSNYNCTIEFTNTLWPDFKFIAIINILLKWSYYKTMQVNEQKQNNKKLTSKRFKKNIYLEDLPSPPPFDSITDN